MFNNSLLNLDEQAQYHRQMILPELGYEGQLKLKKTRVLVVGAGGLGCPVLQYLVAVGVGTIGIIDGDTVEVHNLHRQVLYTPQDVGENKALIATKKLNQNNPNIKIQPFDCYLDNNNVLKIISDYDIVIDGTDNFSSRYRINDACIILKKPFVYGGLTKFQGQIAVFNYQGSATYRCLFPTPPSPEQAPNCSEIGVLGVLPSIIGSLQALESIKIITGIGEVLKNQLLMIDTLKNNYNTIQITLNPKHLNIHTLHKDYDAFCSPVQKVDAKNEVLANTLDKSTLSKYQIIDLRDEYSFQQRNIGGRSIPFSKLENQSKILDKSVAYLLVCKHGITSAKGLSLLIEKGFFNVQHLKNGLTSYWDIQEK